ncbi:uncharacterized protein LOC100568840 [Acyrthosiphon pisum]|uniref:MYND-type domain-containing protein n=1 Tax=Acyrthosiphon pisum TaxID=7029 RepID=A0A8R2ABZ3_ACYPI|nr:uncharacterized protein LOC100568840 [Acyrthosiphon pisum]|eukprot:XP_003246246.1 PREDICTED: uncharacterized protein LOC100568840 [Acyrthosiphon pisum]
MHTKKYIDNLFKNAIYKNPFIQLTAEDVQNCKLSLNKNQHNTLKEDCNKLKENDNFYKDVKTSIDDKMTKDETTTKADITYNNNYSSIEDEPANKKQKVDTNRIDVLELVISRDGNTKQFKPQFKSPLKTNNEIATTSAEEVSLEESIESEKSLEKSVKSMIRIIDPRKMMDEDNYKMWIKNTGIEPKHLRTDIKKLSVAKLSTVRSQPSFHSNKANGVKHTLNGENLVRGNLIKIEKLYIKYFSKCVQDTIVIIANILNIISMSNKYHEIRINESYNKRSEAEKLKEICDADQLHKKHKKILETKLKNNILCVISSFAESEFDSAFQMFFLSILTVLRVLDQQRFRKGGIFKNSVHLLWSSLKNCEFNHKFKQKMFSMFRSKTFQPDCVNLISIIEDSQDTDPGVTDRMTLFFVPTLYSREFFQPVIKAVTCDSNEDLELLIDNANFQCCINSKFKDPVDSSTVLHPNNKIPVLETIQRPINSDVTTQNWFLANNPDKTYQQIPVLNGDTAVEPTIATSQPLNNFYEPLSYSLQKKTSESSTSKVIPTKKYIVVTSAISNSSLVQVTSSFSGTAKTLTPTTFVTFNPSIQNKKSVTNSQLHKAIGGIILIDNKHYKLVRGPLGRMRAVVNGSNKLVTSPSTVIIKCHSKNCNSSVTIMCSVCKTAKYCSYSCQERDWYDNHKDVCRPLDTGP